MIDKVVMRSISELLAIEQVDRLSPQACRTAARERFDVRQMIDRYFGFYEKIARLHSGHPGQAA